MLARETPLHFRDGRASHTSEVISTKGALFVSFERFALILPLILNLRGGPLLTLPLVAFGGTVRAAGRFIIGHGR